MRQGTNLTSGELSYFPEIPLLSQLTIERNVSSKTDFPEQIRSSKLNSKNLLLKTCKKHLHNLTYWTIVYEKSREKILHVKTRLQSDCLFGDKVLIQY